MNLQQRIVEPDGRPTLDYMQEVESLRRQIDALRRQMAAIAAVSDPAGGGTVDAEARTAIEAIIAAADV